MLAIEPRAARETNKTRPAPRRPARRLARLFATTAVALALVPACGEPEPTPAGNDQGGGGALTATLEGMGPIVLHRPSNGATSVDTGSEAVAAVASALTTGNGITYHNGPIMLGTTNVYLIWYGTWTGDTALTLVPDFLNHVSGSGYMNINTSYYDWQATHITNSVRLAGTTTDAGYSQGKSLSDAAVGAIISRAVSTGGLPVDASGVYLVMAAKDVAQVEATKSLCNGYCGWHTFGTIGAVPVKFAFIGNPGHCPSSNNTCLSSLQQTLSPNGNSAADGMINILAHELEESMTDPQVTGWYRDPSGFENGDLCAWNFGSNTYHTANNALANIHLGARDYFIQQNWVNDSGGYCGMAYPGHDVSFSMYAIPENNWQSVFNTVTPLGYRLVWIDGYDFNGATFFNVSFVRDSSIAWTHFFNMDSATYQQKVTTLIGQGYRVQQVASYKSAGNVRYAATFYVQPTYPAWTLYHGVTLAQHQANFNSLTAQGFRLVNQSITDVSGNVQVAALYDKVSVGAWSASYQMTPLQYAAFSTANVQAGRHLAYLDVSSPNATPMFSAVFDSSSVTASQASVGMPALTLQQNQDTEHAQGMFTRLIVGYQNGSVVNFGAFWSK